VSLFGRRGAAHFAPRGRRVRVLCGRVLAEVPVAAVLEAVRLLLTGR